MPLCCKDRVQCPKLGVCGVLCGHIFSSQCKWQYQFLITNLAVLSVLLPQDGSLHFVNFELLGMLVGSFWWVLLSSSCSHDEYPSMLTPSLPPTLFFYSFLADKLLEIVEVVWWSPG